MVTGQPTSESDEGQAAPRRQSDGYGLPCAKTGTGLRREIPNDTLIVTHSLAEPLSQRSMGPPAGRSGWVNASISTRTEASGGKALASQAGAAKAGNDGSLTDFD